MSKALSEPLVSDSRISGEADQTDTASLEKVIVHVHKTVLRETVLRELMTKFRKATTTGGNDELANRGVFS